MPGSCPIQFCSSSQVPLFSSLSPGALILLHTVQSSTWLLHNTLYQRTLGLSPAPSSCYGHYGDSVSLSGRQVWDIPQDRCFGITPVFLSVWRTSVMLYPDQKQLKRKSIFSVNACTVKCSGWVSLCDGCLFDLLAKTPEIYVHLLDWIIIRVNFALQLHMTALLQLGRTPESCNSVTVAWQSWLKLTDPIRFLR